jgi:hypothetical protein
MEANKDEEQELNSEVAEIKRRLEEIQLYFEAHCLPDHKLKAAWLKATISTLQGFSNVDDPPKRWRPDVEIAKNKISP